MAPIRRKLNWFALPVVALFWGYAVYVGINKTGMARSEQEAVSTDVADGSRPLEWGETDHVAEMELCKREIADQVIAVYSWQWGRAWAFGERRIRKGFVTYMARNGEIRTGTFTCTFDVAPIGNDFFID